MDNESFGALTPKKPYLHIRPPSACSLTEVVPERWLIKFGAIYVNQERQMSEDFLVGPDDVVRVHTHPKRYFLDKEFIRSQIVAESENYIVVNKPSGLPMHATLDNYFENLMGAFDFKYFVTHRLDVPTSGLVLIAKTKQYQTQFNRLVSERQVRKLYQVWTQAPVPLGLYRHFMQVSVKAPKIIAAEKNNEGKWDECLLQVLSQNGCEHVVELKTGRTHQIRAQFSYLGAPILGDEMYGGISSEKFGLHACSLDFFCPVEKTQKTFENLKSTY